MAKILFVQPSYDWNGFPRFLLKSSGFWTISMSNVEEAVNWLRIERSLTEKFDAIVFSDCCNSREKRLLIKELEKNDSAILIYLQRYADEEPILTHDKLLTCSPSELFGCLQGSLCSEIKRLGNSGGLGGFTHFSDT